MAGYTAGPEEAPRDVSQREILLNSALRIVTQDRNQAYGDPEDNFKKIGDYWTVYLRQRGGLGWNTELFPHDVAILMILMKVARLAHNPDHRDSWEDIAGYAACGWDCVSG